MTLIVKIIIVSLMMDTFIFVAFINGLHRFHYALLTNFVFNAHINRFNFVLFIKFVFIARIDGLHRFHSTSCTLVCIVLVSLLTQSIA